MSGSVARNMSGLWVSDGNAFKPGTSRYLEQVYMAQHNAGFRVKPEAEGTAFIPYIGGRLPDILCEQHERIVGSDNCVSSEGLKLQIPADGARQLAAAGVKTGR